MAEFHLERFGIGAQNAPNEGGTPDVQAGSHPYSLTNTFVLKANEGTLKDAQVELPPGFVGDPDATAKCSYQDFAAQEEGEFLCSNSTAVGVATVYFYEEGPVEVTAHTFPVYNLVPPNGVAAEFGFLVAKTTPILLRTSVRTGGDYGLTTAAPNINQAVRVLATKVTIWGVPANPAHNSIRGQCLSELGGNALPVEEEGLGLREDEAGLENPIHSKSEPEYTEVDKGLPEPRSKTTGCPDAEPEVPLLTNPTSCNTPRTATFGVDSWEEPGNFTTGEHVSKLSASLPEISGCGKLDFSPTLSVTPNQPYASTASGLAVNIKVPQETTANPVGLGEADVRNVTVALPPGVALNPSRANGLEACSADPGALAGNELGSAGDGIGYQGVKPGTQAGQSVLGFSPAVPGSIAAQNGVSEGLLENREDVLQPGVNFCANASKVATVRIKTPLLPNELTGAVYLAAQEANPFSSLLAMYLVAEDPVSGVLVKLPGEVRLCKGAGEVIDGQRCQGLGQIVTTFLNTPQAPVEEIELHFFGGEKAPLATPSRCGTYTTETAFEPWTGTPAVHPSAEFQIDHGPNGGPCPGSGLPFNPSLTGGVTNINAGAFTPFTLTMNRADGEQNIQSVEAHLPPGLAGILTGVELCPEPQANLGECGPNSLIGETTVSVGVGGDPYTVSGGKDYLTGPYNGTGSCNVIEAGCAPFGIAFEVPAKAGPFDLEKTREPNNHPACDCIVVRGKIEVNPLTAAITIVSNPPGTPDSIPTSIEGIPLEIQHVNATTTRNDFQFNPTSCNKMETSGTIHSSEGGVDSIGVPFQVTNCEHLKFEPKLAVSTQAKTSKANGASLSFKFTNPSVPPGIDANYAKFKVDLPKQLPSRLTTLQKACTQAQFQANPAGCPSASVVGHMVVHTPVLPVPLEGPLYFVSNGGEAFPNLIVVLQGYGVKADLVGDTFISKSGVTSSTFKAIPDFPFTSAEVTLPEGPYSALAANGNLCAETATKTVSKKVTVRVKGRRKTVTRKVKEKVAVALSTPTEFVAQNGAEIHNSTPIDVIGCPPARAKKAAPVKKAAKKHKGKKHGKKR